MHTLNDILSTTRRNFGYETLFATAENSGVRNLSYETLFFRFTKIVLYGTLSVPN
jgi:hypothetical protein